MRANEIVDQALRIQDELAREKFLQEACGSDEVLLGQVKAELDSLKQQSTKHSQYEEGSNETTFVDHKLVDDTDTTAAAGTASGNIGPYRLLQQIGEGGMGVVWMAEQKEPVRRTVALKIIKAGMDSNQVIARFEAERQALALMDHPNIAHVLDAGTTDSGRPYFVMELVKGIPITHYCDRQKMNPEQRLKLFIDVCEAVQHAHQKGIIHRDIKPSNVLVTTDQDKPLVKVIDFGLAKATSHKLTEKTLYTELGQIVGTPAYMSPEQAESAGLDVDTRTDVYSLGVLLYELLTGVTPLDARELRSAGYAEMQRMICEQEPPRMSQRLSSLGVDSDSHAELRSSDSKRLQQRLRGDLDIIAMNALAKEPNRRYSTPNNLADDVQRYLNREPIEARPASAAYRFRKLAERNKGKFVAGVLLMLVLIGGIVGTSVGMLESQRQEQIAKQNLATAEENYLLAKESVDRYFTIVSQNRLLNEPHMIGLRRELLTSAQEFYEVFVERRKDDPDAVLDLASAHVKLGGIYERLGDKVRAEREFRTAQELAEQLPKTNKPAMEMRLGCAVYLGDVLISRGEYEAALEHLNNALNLADEARIHLPDRNETDRIACRFHALRADVFMHQNRSSDAIDSLNSSIEVLRRLKQEQPENRTCVRDLAIGLDKLGQVTYALQKDEETEENYRQAVENWREVLATETDSIELRTGLGDSLTKYAMSLRRLGRHEDAVESGQEAVDIARELADQHPELTSVQDYVVSTLGNFSVVQKEAGDQKAADELNNEAIRRMSEIVEQFPGDVQRAKRLAAVQGNEGNSKMSAGDWKEAIRWFDDSNETLMLPLEKSPEDPMARAIMRNNHWGRADCFLAMDRPEEAVEAYQQAVDLTLPQGQPEVRMDRAKAIVRTGDYETAVTAVRSEESAIESLNQSNRALVWFRAAGVLIDASKAAAEDDALEMEVRESRAAELRQESLAALLHAYKNEHFKGKDVDKVLGIERFSTLADEPEFKKLLDSLKANKANQDSESN